MLTETEKYRLALYETREVLRKTDECVIEKVYCALDAKIYIKRSYPDDKREVFQRLKSLQSSHIPQVHDIFFSDGTVIIEQYIDGLTLSNWLERNRLSAGQADSFAAQLLEGLDALHKHGIIHRDIKPDNIMIDESENTFLIDYGIARIYQKETGQDTRALGTIGFAAPEQYGFSQSDFRTDLYALGVTLNALVEASGHRGALRRVAARCSRFDPERRYPTANAALRDLKGKRLRTKIIAAIIPAVLAITAAVLIFSHPVENEKPVATQSHSAEPSTEEPAPSEVSSGSVEPSPEAPASSEVSFDELSEEQWSPIIENYTDGPLVYELLPADSSGEIDMIPGLAFSYKMENGVLSLYLAEQVFEFSHTSEWLPDYEGTSVEGEVLLYDMDGDGRDEILVALSDRIVLQGPHGNIIRNTNWRAVWCVGGTPAEGFWRAEGELVTYSNHGTIALNLVGARELYANDVMNGMVLSGRELLWLGDN